MLTTAEQDWFVQLQLYGGFDSQINKVAANATAYFNRGNLWTIQVCVYSGYNTNGPASLPLSCQIYASSSDHKPPFPREGFAFLDGVVAAITANEPESYRYGCVPRDPLQKHA